MPHRRLVQIGKLAPLPLAAELPTIGQYFRDLALRQGEDIRLLKARAEEEIEKRVQPRAQGAKSVREEAWRLHPHVAKKRTPPPSRAAAKKRSVGKKNSRRSR